MIRFLFNDIFLLLYMLKHNVHMDTGILRFHVYDSHIAHWCLGR